MREISLHVMDIIQNSVEAGAAFIEVEIIESSAEDLLQIKIQDDGSGIDDKILPNITDPFTTSRKSRRVGLGLPLFESACIRCGGSLGIDSKVGCGTTVKAIMKHSHIDRAPMGRIEDTIISFLIYPNIELLYTHRVDGREFRLDTRELKRIAGEDLNNQEILQWVREYLIEGLDSIGSQRF